MNRREFLCLPIVLMARQSNGAKIKQTVLDESALAGQLLVNDRGNLHPYIGQHPFAGMVIEDTPGGTIYYLETTQVREK